jgi:(2Fe-2S) ferredoxin
VVVCDGHRCHALRDRTDTGVAEGEASTLLGALRERVRRSRFAVLIRSGCLGVCSRAPAVWVTHRAVPRANNGPGVLFGPVECPRHVRRVLDEVPADGDDPPAGTSDR